jgi:hypothetical protein
MAKKEQGQGEDQFREFTQNLFDGMRDIFKRSAEEVVSGARVTKTRIDIYQLRRDRDHFLMRLGEVAYDLMDEAAIDHPDLAQPFHRVRAIEDKITDYERGITETFEEDVAPVEEEAAPAPKKKAAPKKAAAKKPAAKKPAAKKPATKKAAPKKAAAKKPAAKKPAAKKPAAKKTTKKSTKKTGASSKKKL